MTAPRGVAHQVASFLVGLALGVLGTVGAYSAQLARLEERCATTARDVGELRGDVQTLRAAIMGGRAHGE